MEKIHEIELTTHVAIDDYELEDIFKSFGVKWRNSGYDMYECETFFIDPSNYLISYRISSSPSFSIEPEENGTDLSITIYAVNDENLQDVLKTVDDRLKSLSPLLKTTSEYQLKSVGMSISIPLWQIDNGMTRDEKNAQLLEKYIVPEIHGWAFEEDTEHEEDTDEGKQYRCDRNSEGLNGRIWWKREYHPILGDRDVYTFGMTVVSADEPPTLGEVEQNKDHPMYSYLLSDECEDILLLYTAQKFETDHLIIDDSLDEFSDVPDDEFEDEDD